MKEEAKELVAGNDFKSLGRVRQCSESDAMLYGRISVENQAI
jgi:hypothetical protein